MNQLYRPFESKRLAVGPMKRQPRGNNSCQKANAQEDQALGVVRVILGVEKERCGEILAGDDFTVADRFTYFPESNSYRCPAAEQLNCVGLNVTNRTLAYIGSRKRCGACPQKAQCTTGQYKYLAIHIHEPARQRARDLVNTPAFAHSQRQRRKVEALFAAVEQFLLSRQDRRWPWG